MRRSAALIACALALTGVLAVAAASASAAENVYARNFEGQVAGFERVTGLSTDPSGNLWVTQGFPAHLGSPALQISEYSPFPALSKIGEQSGQGLFEGGSPYYASAAIDGVNGYLYVANGNNEPNVQVFDPHNFVEEWSIPSGANRFVSFLAVENSGGPFNGRVYVSIYGDPAEVLAYEPGQVAAPFSCTTCSYEEGGGSYVEGNAIVGTPAGPFEGELLNVQVDSQGNIFVSYPRTGVAEFKPSGEFIRQFPESSGYIAVDPTSDHLLASRREHGFVEYSASGEIVSRLTEGAPGEHLNADLAAVDSAGRLYVDNSEPGGTEASRIDVFSPAFILPKITYEAVSPLLRNSATLNATVSPNGGEPVTSCRIEYGTDTTYSLGSKPCEPDPASNPPASNLTTATPVRAELSNLTTSTTYHYRIIAGNAKVTQTGEDQEFTTPPAVAGAVTDPATEITNNSAVLNGHYDGDGLDTSYYFQYGTSTKYGHEAPPLPADNGIGSGPQAVPPVLIENLVPGTTYHYRLVASNSTGVAFGPDDTLTTYQSPTIEGLSSSGVSATAANLQARVNPQGLPVGTEAECRFEYGPTTSYGSTKPCPELLSGTAGQAVAVNVEGLQRGVTYHFRVVASNRWGTTISEDQSFEFFPSLCPNSALRQQTGTAYLPDCRAYELVSPANANGTILYTGGPNAGQATAPSRFAFVGRFSSLPGSEVVGTAGDLYVSTRTDSGWQSRYIGPSGSEASCVGASPNDPWSRKETTPLKIQEHVFTDPSMSSFIDFFEGTGTSCTSGQNGPGDATGPINLPSILGHVWAADGSSLGTLPAGLTATELGALRCPNSPGRGAYQNWGVCHGDVAASGDLSHFFFSSNLLNFTPGGSAEEPGGAYDYNRATGTLTRISGLAAGGEIAPGAASDFPVPEPFDAESSPFIHFAAVSSDGSHVLMTNAVRSSICFNYDYEKCRRYTDLPIHLYMSIADAPAIAVSESQLTHEDLAVNYIGMTPDGSKVYFTSNQHLTAEDPGHVGASLYMWEAAKAIHGEDPLTLISKANPGSPAGAGDTAACTPVEDWTAACGVTVYSPTNAYAEAAAGRGGNGISDGPIAANGDIYFYSPEQLDGDHGVAGQQNLYDYREGGLRFVNSFPVEDTCPPSELPDGSVTNRVEGPCGTNSSTCLVKVVIPPQGGGGGIEGLACSEGPAARMEISPDDNHMAFVSASRVTAYDNVDTQGSCRPGAGGEPSLETHCTEMYSYDPTTGSITCDSCNPSGQPPTADVYASQDGLFMTNDGRTFFSTEEALVPADTNEAVDVYEYVDGRPHLITSGTGLGVPAKEESSVAVDQTPGLVGVSANGTDVYFSTFDSLISEDQNGNFLKFYDARANGGFPQLPTLQPCAAAEECHGPGTEAPTPLSQGTAATLSGGNAGPHAHRVKKHHKKHHKRADKRTDKKRHARRPDANRGGAK